MQKQLLALMLALLSSQALAQSSNEAGLLPSINLNKKLAKDWSLNFKSEFRQSLYQEHFSHEYVRTDLAFLVGKKIGIHTSVAGGYQLIIGKEETRNRYMQQVNLITPTRGLTLGHRFSSDQTFGPASKTEVRFRYRLSSEIPLNGSSLDQKEWYLKISNEYVNAFEGEDYDLEIRVLGFMGFVPAPNRKIEVGIDYRADQFVEAPLRNRFWIGLNLFQSF